MTLLVAAIAVPTFFALLFTAIAVRCARRRRPLATAFSSLGCTVSILVGVAIALIGSNLLTWSRLTHESPAAQLTFTQNAARAFDVDVRFADGRDERFLLRGDEWQIDARVLKWRPLASLMGFDTLYRLERLSGRYAAIDTERAAPHSVYRLHAPDDFDVWSLVRAAREHLPWVDALYGSAVYLPMADMASFDVSVGAAGLIARPRNDAARRAISGWH